MKTKKKLHYAWVILIGVALMVGLTKAGLSTIGGLFLTPITTDLGIGMGSLTLYFSIASIVTMFFLPLAGKIIAKYNVRVVLISSSYAITSWWFCSIRFNELCMGLVHLLYPNVNRFCILNSNRRSCSIKQLV